MHPSVGKSVGHMRRVRNILGLICIVLLACTLLTLFLAPAGYWLGPFSILIVNFGTWLISAYQEKSRRIQRMEEVEAFRAWLKIRLNPRSQVRMQDAEAIYDYLQLGSIPLPKVELGEVENSIHFPNINERRNALWDSVIQVDATEAGTVPTTRYLQLKRLGK